MDSPENTPPSTPSSGHQSKLHSMTQGNGILSQDSSSKSKQRKRKKVRVIVLHFLSHFISLGPLFFIHSKAFFHYQYLSYPIVLCSLHMNRPIKMTMGKRGTKKKHSFCFCLPECGCKALIWMLCRCLYIDMFTWLQNLIILYYSVFIEKYGLKQLPT